MNDLINVHMGYDFMPFEEAKKHSDHPFEPEKLQEVISYLISWGNHDRSIGGCESFQIYNDDGVIIYNSINQDSNTQPDEAA